MSIQKISETELEETKQEKTTYTKHLLEELKNKLNEKLAAVNSKLKLFEVV